MTSAQHQTPGIPELVQDIRQTAAANGQPLPGRDQLVREIREIGIPATAHQVRLALQELKGGPGGAKLMDITSRTPAPDLVSGSVRQDASSPDASLRQDVDSPDTSARQAPDLTSSPDARPRQKLTRRVRQAKPDSPGGTHQATRPGDQTASDQTPIHRGWLVLLALPAFVAVWGGWVGLGGLAGFGPVALLPGIADHFKINLAVTLPAGMELYAVIGLRVWLSEHTKSTRTRGFAMWSSIGALTVGCLGQIAYHILSRATQAGTPLFVTICVACLPVAILGVGAALFHLMGEDQRGDDR